MVINKVFQLEDLNLFQITIKEKNKKNSIHTDLNAFLRKLDTQILKRAINSLSEIDLRKKPHISESICFIIIWIIKSPTTNSHNKII